jgi:hypothetical protein
MRVRLGVVTGIPWWTVTSRDSRQVERWTMMPCRRRLLPLHTMTSIGAAGTAAILQSAAALR